MNVAKKEPQGSAVISAYLLVTAAWAAACVVSWHIRGVTVDKVDGLTMFAAFFVLAQAVERFVEPFVSAGPAPTKAGVLGFSLRTSSVDAAQRTADRRVWIWGFATAVALLLAGWTRLDFLAIVGVHGVPNPAVILVTGLVVGSGTKPLHELIKRLETPKSTSSGGTETG